MRNKYGRYPEEDYKLICAKKEDAIVAHDTCRRIANGTSLPKRHGRLIILSEDIVKKEQTSLSFSCQNWISEVGLSNATLAIIEADKESEG